MRFLNRTPLVLYRKEESEGYLGEDGVWVYASQEQEIPFRCSLQPYIKNSQEELDLPEGVKQEDLRYVFTKTPIRTGDDRLKVKADEIEIDGVRYQCLSVKNFTGFGLKSDHYECMFARKDKL